jgi:hypothetical protein
MIPKEIKADLPGVFYRIRKADVFGEGFEFLLDLFFDDLGRGRGHSRMIFNGLAPKPETFRLEGGFKRCC